MATVLSACGEIARAQDPDRYLCALFAKPAPREALFAILAFNQEVAKTREMVSEPMLGQIRLRWWREAIDGIVAGTPRQHEVVNPLADAFSAFALDRTAFDAILDAREADLEDAPFATLANLTDYARRTAGSLSAIELEILGVRDPATTRAAESVSLAWSLTGLLRAIPFHARQKRLMLPAEMLESNGARIGDYHELRDREAIRAVVRSIAETASGALSDARGGSGVRFNAAAPVLLQGHLASLYLNRFERAGWNAFDPAINAPMPLTSWSLWWASIRRRF
jgi:NADH dehydrogenase [ubiquinone] 1 alpha subcomplex assembly factor 6